MTPDSAANARLCVWLGIAPKEWHLEIGSCGTGFSSKSLAMAAHQLNPGSVLSPIYPALATREGFWMLWDALKAKGEKPRVEAGGVTYAWMAKEKDGSQSIPAQSGSTPEAALFAAACALMEREAGNG